MGSGGVPSRSVIVVNGRHGDLPTRGAKPNSRYDLYVYGQKIQSRWFNSEGKAVRNRDYSHQNAHANHNFPHDHNWIWERGIARRIKDNLKPDYQNFN